jgi:hypothetical protein
MYDQSQRAAKLKMYTGVSLAWWHSYKWATTKIMQVFGKDIIGPMFHHLFPNKEFSVAKMKLPALTTYLTFIRLAYPAFKEQLHTATGRADLTVRQQTVLQNMTDLVEFFIPVVSLLFAVLICAVVLQPFLSYASQLCVGIIPIQILFTKKKKTTTLLFASSCCAPHVPQQFFVHFLFACSGKRSTILMTPLTFVLLTGSRLLPAPQEKGYHKNYPSTLPSLAGVYHVEGIQVSSPR